ncbi:MAG TPA: hypothetical protein VGG18_09985 [Granulicella sp.]|jgi:hypothetical protein
MGFDGSALVVTRGHGGPDDKTPTKLGNLSVGSMLSATALAGTTGTDVELIQGQQWQERTGDRITNLHGSWTGHVFKNETWTIDGDFTFTVNGKTVDNRIGVHHQTNTNPRFDHFIHTRTETHDQPQVIHQPTTDTQSIWQKLEIGWEKHSFNGLYVTANAIKLELDLLEATEKIVVIDRKEFHCKNKPSEFTIGGVKADVWAFITKTVPLTLKTAALFTKFVAADIASGIRAALSAPWGS